METRAAHVMVGSFVLSLLIGLVLFTAWIAKVDLDADYNDYDLYFSGSVFGLYKRSIVYYQGIAVGEVNAISLAKEDPSKVRVEVRLRADVPVVEGSKAHLEFQGLTGVAYIELTGGQPGAAILSASPGQERPVIEAEAGAFQEIFQNAPNLLNEALLTVVQLRKLLNDETLAKIDQILSGLATLSNDLSSDTEGVAPLLVEIKHAVENLAETAAVMQNLATTGQKILDGDAQKLLARSVDTMTAAQDLVIRLDRLVAVNETPITGFVNTSLPELSRMIGDLRAAARDLSRLMGRLEQNPVDVLLDPGSPRYDLKKRQDKGPKE